MKLAFWSSSKGNVGVTSNMACISIVAALGYSYKAILFENHYQTNDIGRLIKYHHANLLYSINHSQVKSMGINHIMKNLSYAQFFNLSNTHQNNYTKEFKSLVLNDSKSENNQNYKSIVSLIKEATLEIVDNYLYYLPTNTVIPSNIYDFAMNHYVKNILEGAQELADIVYVDTSKDNYLSTKVILDEVDLVVVNLNQNLKEFKYFFQNYASLIEKCVFLISNYNLQSNLSMNKISYIFSIPKTRIAAIPHNQDYQDALSRGSLVEFLYSNIDCSYYDPLYPFIDGVQKAVTMILMEVFNQKKGE